MATTSKKSTAAPKDSKKSGSDGKKTAQEQPAGHQSHTTTDHDTIRQWVEARGGRPAAVAGTHTDEDTGILRIDFAEPTPSLEEIPWDNFFAKFDEQKLAFLYQEETKDGGTSRFFKFVKR